jgi:predicted RNA polymerase sigma factor
LNLPERAQVHVTIEIPDRARTPLGRDKRTAEAAFYDAFFSAVSRWATDLPAITEAALTEASRCGVEAMGGTASRARAAFGKSTPSTASP